MKIPTWKNLMIFLDHCVSANKSKSRIRGSGCWTKRTQQQQQHGMNYTYIHIHTADCTAVEHEHAGARYTTACTLASWGDRDTTAAVWDKTFAGAARQMVVTPAIASAIHIAVYAANNPHET